MTENERVVAELRKTTFAKEQQGLIAQVIQLLVTNAASIKHLEKRDRKLSALEAGGVDNWEWYGESLADLPDEDGE